MTIGQRLKKAETDLRRSGVPEAKASVEILMARVLGVGRNALFFERERTLGAIKKRVFARMIRKRLARVPVPHILGTQAFLDLELAAGPQALVPRPETEELAAAAMKAFKPRRLDRLRILDLGTGTGCLAIALARLFPHAQVLATDKSQPALALARRNARAHGLGRRIRFQKNDFFRSHLKGCVRPRAWADLVVSNPPYIPTKQISKLPPEVRREPRLALDGGQDGLTAISAVVSRAQEALKPGGVLALEFGWGQSRKVAKLLRAQEFLSVQILKDAQGLERIALAIKAR